MSIMDLLLKLLVEICAPPYFVYFGLKAVSCTEEERDRAYAGKNLSPTQKRFIYSSRYVMLTRAGGLLAMLIGICLGGYELVGIVYKFAGMVQLSVAR